MGGCGGFMGETYAYWLNGMLPLATLLNDTGVLSRQLRSQVQVIVARASAQNDWLGPLDARSQGVPRGCWCIWSTFRMMTALLQYADTDVTPQQDSDAIGRMLFRWAVVLADFLASKPILPADFDSVRWVEAAAALQALLDSRRLAGLASPDQAAAARTAMELLAMQGLDWPSWITSPEFPLTCDSASWCNYADWIPFIGQGVHGVNVASGISAAATLHRMGRPRMLAQGREVFEKLQRYHGTAMGATTSCECVSGRSPAKGTETCTVVETVNSLCMLLGASGDLRYADEAEHIALNGYGAAFYNGSMNSMKYFQLPNMIDDTYEPVYECCLSNHAQGWPRFAARQMATMGPKADPLLLFFFPSTVVLPLGDSINSTGGQLRMTVSTAFPFDEHVYLDVSATCNTTLWVRVPGWAKRPTAEVDGRLSLLDNGTAAPFLLVVTPGMPHGAWVRKQITLTFPMPIRVERRWNNALSVFRGPLLYALPLPYSSQVMKTCASSPLRPAGMGPTFGCTNKLQHTSEWRYALDARSAEDFTFAPRGHDILDTPPGQGQWNVHSCNVSLRVRARRMRPEAWVYNSSLAGRHTKAPIPPKSPIDPRALIPGGHAEELVLLPYGVTDLRLTELPTMK
jgi:hypothetical protein